MSVPYQDQTDSVTLPVFTVANSPPSTQGEWFDHIRRYMLRINHFATFENLPDPDKELIHQYASQTGIIITFSLLAAFAMIPTIIVSIFAPSSLLGFIPGVCFLVLALIDLKFYLNRQATVNSIKARYNDLRADLSQSPGARSARYYLYPQNANTYHQITRFLKREHFLEVYTGPLSNDTIDVVTHFFEHDENGQLNKEFFQADSQTQFNMLLTLVANTGHELEVRCNNPEDYKFVDIKNYLLIKEQTTA